MCVKRISVVVVSCAPRLEDTGGEDTGGEETGGEYTGGKDTGGEDRRRGHRGRGHGANRMERIVSSHWKGFTHAEIEFWFVSGGPGASLEPSQNYNKQAVSNKSTKS